ncbi:MAG: glycosyltransferase family 9 protein [Desulfobacterales bacterium]
MNHAPGVTISTPPAKVWNHLIVVKPGALGDTLLLAPVLRAVRAVRPDLFVTVVGSLPAAGLLESFGVADSVVSFDRLHLFASPRPGEPRFEAAAVMAFLGLPVEEADPFLQRGAVQAVWAPSRPGEKGPHVVLHLREKLTGLIPELPEPALEAFSVPPLAVSPFPSPYVVLAPGAGGIDRQLPFERFVELARNVERSGRTPVFIAGEAEVERGMAVRFPASWPSRLSPSLPELAGILTGAEKFYGNDSGPGHLAALLGVDTTVFFGPSDPDIWRPWGTRVTVKPFPGPADAASD